MKKEPLPIKIIRFIKGYYPVWIGGIAIERLALENGYKPSQASRRCRELAAGKTGSGLSVRYFRPVLEVRKLNGHVEYRYLSPPPPTPEQKQAEQLRILVEATK